MNQWPFGGQQVTKKYQTLWQAQLNKHSLGVILKKDEIVWGSDTGLSLRKGHSFASRANAFLCDLKQITYLVLIF